MVGPALSFKEVKANARSLPGIKIVNGRVFYRTLYGNWKEMLKTDFIWHRGKGRWSKITPSVDLKRLAHKIPEKRWKRHPHTGDLPRKKI